MERVTSFHMKEGLQKEKLKLKKKILLLTTVLFLEAEKEKKKLQRRALVCQKVWIMEQTQYDCEIYYAKSEIPPWKPNLRQAPLDLLLLYD